MVATMTATPPIQPKALPPEAAPTPTPMICRIARTVSTMRAQLRPSRILKTMTSSMIARMNAKIAPPTSGAVPTLSAASDALPDTRLMTPDRMFARTTISQITNATVTVVGRPEVVFAMLLAPSTCDRMQRSFSERTWLWPVCPVLGPLTFAPAGHSRVRDDGPGGRDVRHELVDHPGADGPDAARCCPRAACPCVRGR
jgi:hypothetical protein